MAQRQVLRQDVEELKNDLSKLGNDLSALTKRVVEMGRDETVSAKENLDVEVRKLLQEIGTLLDETGRKGKRAAESVQKKIERKPFMSLLVIFILGFILGKVLDRK